MCIVYSEFTLISVFLMIANTENQYGWRLCIYPIMTRASINIIFGLSWYSLAAQTIDILDYVHRIGNRACARIIYKPLK